MCRIIESIELLAIDINDMPWQVYDEVDWINIMIKINAMINVGIPIKIGILTKIKIGIPTKITNLIASNIQLSNASIIFKSSNDSHSYPHLPDKSSGP